MPAKARAAPLQRADMTGESHATVAGPREMIAGHAIVEILKAEGVRAVYGLPGGHVLPIYDGLYHTPDIRHFLVRHEQAAANMAAAHAQLTGETAVPPDVGRRSHRM